MKTMVLLSGGLDSTAALLWALAEDPASEAVFIYYGQPAAQHECERAIAVARELGVTFHRLDLASAFYGGASRGIFVSPPSGMAGGVDTAFVPLRNPLLLSAAAARSLMLWPDEQVRLVVGFNANDRAGFPDCRPEFIAAFEEAINAGLGRAQISVEAPWLLHTKRELVLRMRAIEPERFALIEASWSCYAERGPCGVCTACKTRDEAFREASA